MRPHFTAQEDIVCEVNEGNSGVELWREAHLHSVDLFLAGSKPRSVGRGILPQKFVRKSTCSVCLVPEHPPALLRKIMVPTDFSEDATRALSLALSLAQPPVLQQFQRIGGLPIGSITLGGDSLRAGSTSFCA